MHARAFLVSLPLLSVASYVVGCEHEDEHATTPAPGLGDVVYAGAATDEALKDMLAVPAKSGDKRARIAAPVNGAKLSAAPTFSWTFATSSSDAGAVGWFEPPWSRTPVKSATSGTNAATFASLLAAAFPGERSAYAHGDPVNGTAYFLVLSTAQNEKLLRVFTTATTYLTDAAAWDKVKKASASGAIRAVVTTGLFDNDKVISGGGPFEGEAISFEVSQ